MPPAYHPIYLPPAMRDYVRARGYSDIAHATPSGLEMMQGMYGIPMRPAPDELRRPLGHTGVRPMAGQLDMLEQNPKLIPSRWRGEREPGVVHNMVRADSACAAVHNVWRRHLGRVPIDVEPAKGGDANDLRLAEFVRACLWEYMRGGFDAWRAEASAYPVMTPMSWELVWGVDDRAGRAHGIDGPAVILQALEPRLAWTIHRWVSDAGEWSMVQWPEYGDPDAGRPQTGYGAPAAPLHWSKLLRLTHDGLGGDPEGVSLMRPAWWPYQLRQIIGPLLGVTARKTAHGVPVARPGQGANPADADTVARMLRFYGAGSESYLMIDAEGWELDVIKLEGDIDKLQAVYAAAARDIAVGALAHALFTGADGTGSFALIDGQQDPYALAVDDAAQAAVRPWNQGPTALIKRLVDFNMPGVRAYPFLRVGRLPFGSLSSYLGMVQAAVTAGSMLPDADLDAWQREQVGAPPMRPETVEAWRYRQRNPGPAPEVIPSPGNEPPPEPPPSAPTGAPPPSEPAAEERTDASTDRAREGQAVLEGAGVALADRLPWHGRGEWAATLTGPQMAACYRAQHAPREPIPSAVAYMEARAWRFTFVPLAEVHIAQRDRQEGDDLEGASNGAFDPDKAAPIIAARGWGGLPDGKIGVLDGRHRCVMAQAAGHTAIRGYMPDDPGRGGLSDGNGPTANQEPAGRPGTTLADIIPTFDPDMPASGPRGRKVRPVETCIRLSETTEPLNRAREDIGAIIRRWEREQSPGYIEAVLEKPDIKAARGIHFPGRRDLTRELSRAYWRYYLLGVQSVRKETARLRKSPDLASKAAAGELEVGQGGDLPTPARLADVHGPACGAGCRRHGPSLADLWSAPLPARWLLEDDDDDGPKDAPPTDAQWKRFRETVRREFYPAHPDLFQGQGAGTYYTRTPPPLDRDEFFADYAAAIEEFYARHPEFNDWPIPTPEHVDDPLATLNPGRAAVGAAGTTADKAADRMEGAILDAVQNQTVGGFIRSPTEEEARVIQRVHREVQAEIDGADLKKTLERLVGEMSEKWDQQAAGKDLGMLFGMGRTQETLATADVKEMMYSNLLESNVCEECQLRDGVTYPPEPEMLSYYATPASWCLGGDHCRCLNIAIPY